MAVAGIWNPTSPPSPKRSPTASRSGPVSPPRRWQTAFRPGDHATTFGGGPVVCAAALAVLDEIEDRHLLANCRARSEQLRAGLESLPGVVEVRGRGLLLAAVLDSDRAGAVAESARELGLIVNAVRPDAVRFAPPLSIIAEEVDMRRAIRPRCRRLVKPWCGRWCVAFDPDPTRPGAASRSRSTLPHHARRTTASRRRAHA